MAKEYIQTELAIEVAKKALEDLCKEYGYNCIVIIGDPLTTIVQDVPIASWDEDCWPEVMATNIPLSDAKNYLESQHITHDSYILLQTERIKNDYKY